VADILKQLLEFLGRQPIVIRTFAVIVLVVCIGVPVGLKVRDMIQEMRPVARDNPRLAVAAPGTYGIGTPIRPPDGTGETLDGQSQNQALAQLQAPAWHNRHSGQDDPPWVYIDSGDQTENFIKYKFFRKSDGCVNVVRSQQGIPTDQWIVKPGPPPNLHADASPDSKHGAEATHSMMPVTLPFIATLHAAGQCLNPHPGAFESWWGRPEDDCWAPMYRRFADGCEHLQRYNRCANAWDQRIQWQKCVH